MQEEEKREYYPLRRDLTEGTEKCYFCEKSLSSLKAFVLQHLGSNKIVFSGPSCAKKNITSDYSLKAIPDLTKYTLSVNERESSGNNKGGGNRKGTNDRQDAHKRAIEYLELRESKLKENFHTSYSVLERYYDLFLENKALDESQIQHILNIEKRAPEKLQLENLQRCYNYSFWIERAISVLEGENDDFLKSVKNYLKQNMQITENQKQAVNKWLENLSGIPQLK